MKWIQLAMLLVKLLRELQNSSSIEEFKSSPTAIKASAFGDGTILSKLWEHREEILAFFLMLFESFSKSTPTPQAIRSDYTVIDEVAEELTL